MASNATLRLSANGNIASASGIYLDGTFDISGAGSSAVTRTLNGLIGSNSAAAVTLGANSLSVDGASGASFAGSISGTGGFELASGEQTLTGNSSYTGATRIGGDSTLKLAAAGDISESSGALFANGSTLDISGIAGSTANLAALDGSGATVALGSKSIKITSGIDSTSFSGTMSGDGKGNVIVSGKQAFTYTSISGGVVAMDGGTVNLTGGSITALSDSGDHAALSIANGGTINVIGTVMSATGTNISAYFDQADKIANVTIGTGAYFVSSADNTLLYVQRFGDGSNGIVNLTIDNGGLGTDRTITGNIIDDPTKLTGNGKTNVTVAAGSAWSGKTDAAGFTVAAGASAFFAEGSKINGNLTMEEGAIVNGETANEALEILGDGVFKDGVLNGNMYFHGSVSLGGLSSPGHSLGYLDVGVNFDVAGPGSVSPGAGGVDEGIDALSGARAKLEVAFGYLDPQAGVNFDQINVGNNLTGGMLPVQLASLSDRSVGLGNLDAIELLRVGGAVDAGAGLRQVNRVTQNGREVRIDGPRTTAATTDLVVGAMGATEEVFFGPGDVTVYGLKAFVQDETYSLAALTGMAHNAGVVMLGNFADRVNADRRNGVWMRTGGAYADIDDTIDQTLGFTGGGLDLIASDMFRLGVLGSYGSSSGQVQTDLGKSEVSGSSWNAGVEATFSSGGFYADAVAQYGGSDWTILPVEAKGATKIGTTTALAALETGYTIGSETGSITPWGQLVYQMTEYGDVDSAWVNNVDFTANSSLLLRGGLRVEADLGGMKPYANLAVAQDTNDRKTVIVDGFQQSTGSGGPRVEMGGGFSAMLGENLTLSTALSGTHGIGDAGFTSYQGKLGVKGKW